jgi:hypothetical protein
MTARAAKPEPFKLRRPAIVVFGDTGDAHWFDCFTRPGFRHVWLLVADDRFGGTLELLTGYDMFAVRWSPHDIARVAADLVEAHCGLALVGECRIGNPAPARPFLSCVEIAKHALGVRAWWILTPFQLYRHLRARGAQVLAFEPRAAKGD